MNKSIILYRGSSEQRLDPEICSLVRHSGVWRNRNRKRKKKKIGHVVVYIFLAPRTNDTKQCESYNWQRRFLVPACNAFKRKVTIAGWGSAKQRRKCKGIHQRKYCFHSQCETILLLIFVLPRSVFLFFCCAFTHPSRQRVYLCQQCFLRQIGEYGSPYSVLS